MPVKWYAETFGCSDPTVRTVITEMSGRKPPPLSSRVNIFIRDNPNKSVSWYSEACGCSLAVARREFNKVHRIPVVKRARGRQYEKWKAKVTRLLHGTVCKPVELSLAEHYRQGLSAKKTAAMLRTAEPVVSAVNIMDT